MENKNEMTPLQSLEIIKSMMNQSRKDTQRVLGKYMMLCGLLVVLTATASDFLWRSSHEYNGGWLWLTMSVVGTAMTFYMRQKKEAHVPSSYITKSIGMVWWTIGIFCCLFGFSASFIGELCQQINAQGVITGQPTFSLHNEAIIMLFFGIAATATGFILKDYLISICGVLSGFGGFIGCLLLNHASFMPVMAGVAFISMVIPGFRIILINKRLCSSH